MDRENQRVHLYTLEGRVAANPDSIEDIHNLADVYADQGRWDEAIKAYKTAITLQPTNADLHNSLGTVYEEERNLEEAEQAYQQAVQLQPKDSIYYYNLGSLYEEQRRLTEAIQAFEKCLLHSTDPEERSEVRNKLSSILPDFKDVVGMYKSLRVHSFISLGLGGLSIFSGGTLDPTWGILLIVVAFLSSSIKIPAIFVLYSVVLAWAAVMNGLAALTGAGLQWIFWALLQVLGTISTLEDFIKYKRLPLQALFEAGIWPANLTPPQQEPIISKRLAIAGALLAVVAAILLPSVIIGSITSILSGRISPQNLQLVDWLLSGSVDIAVLAFGLSCMALLSKNTKKRWASVGTIISALVLIGWVGFLLFLNFAQ